MPYTLRADIKLPKMVPRKVSKYPFAEMKKGDSFAVPLVDLNKVRVHACMYGKEHRKRFAVRREDPLHDKNYRCWRVK